MEEHSETENENTFPSDLHLLCMNRLFSIYAPLRWYLKRKREYFQGFLFFISDSQFVKSVSRTHEFEQHTHFLQMKSILICLTEKKINPWLMC